jgi:ribosomal protein S18 acetylase RimI-like enzyme
MSESAERVTVRQVFRPNRREALAIVECYHECFDIEQRIADPALLGLIDDMPDSTKNAFYIAEQGEQIVGFAYVLFFPSFRLAHLMYLGVTQEGRGHGAGRRLFDVVVERCRRSPNRLRCLTVEVVRPDSTADPEVRRQREATVTFLERLGCHRLEADFQTPPLGPRRPVVPHWIMGRPLAGADEGVGDVAEIALDLYRLVYGLPEDHALVKHCLDSIDAA